MHQAIDFAALVVAGLQQRLTSALALPSAPIMIATSDRWRLADMLGRTRTASAKPTPTFPLCFLRIASVAIQDDAGYNAQALQYLGTYSGGTDLVRKYRPTPVSYTFEFTRLDHDSFSQLGFIHHWLANVGNRSALNFSVTYDSAPWDVRVMLDRQLQAPDKESSIDAVGVFELTANLTINSFLLQPPDSAPTAPIVGSAVPVVQVRQPPKDW